MKAGEAQLTGKVPGVVEGAGGLALLVGGSEARHVGGEGDGAVEDVLVLQLHIHMMTMTVTEHHGHHRKDCDK